MNFSAIPPPPATLELKPSAIFAFFKAAPPAALSCGFLWLAYHLHPVFITCSLLAMIISGYRYASIRRIRYLLTRRVIRISSGILIRRTRSVELCRVTGYAITQSLWMQLFKLMVLTLEMAGPESRAVVFRGIPACPAGELISRYVQAARLGAGGCGTQLAFNF
jgi:uncharacterized membrane protein YdbT with pleckstrin-like domain